MEATSEKSGSSNLTVKLDHADRQRLKLLAVAKNSLVDYQKTGSHITLEEFSEWTKELKKNPKTPMPECHK
jgi:hypothetical protein